MRWARWKKAKIIYGNTILAGDAVLGLASSGAHSNGYSLIRKILEVSGADLNRRFPRPPLGDVVMTPTRIYVKPLLALMQALPVKGMAHITGGGLLENIPRMLPDAPHRRAGQIQLGHAAAVPLAAAARQRGRQRNAPHLQLRHRHGRGGGRRAMPSAPCKLLHAAGETVYRIGEIRTRSRRPSTNHRAMKSL